MKLFILLISFFANVCGQQYIDESCTTLSNENGQCAYFEDCPSARTNLMKGIPPKNCGFNGARSIVCCVDGNDIPVLAVQAVTTEKFISHGHPTENTNLRLKIDVSKTKRLCEQKCDAYAKFVFTRTPSATFLPGAEDDITDTCGALDVELIIGGSPAKPRELPHMALVGYPNNNTISWSCGGSLISEKYILTAAHCLYHRQFGAAKYIRLGGLHYADSTADKFVQKLTIAKIMPHPEYAPPLQYHDIALLELNQTVVFNAFVRPACLQVNMQINNAKAIASGWGVTEFGGLPSEVLMQVTLDLFSYVQCNKTYKPTMKLVRGLDNTSMLCAGSKTAEKDSCQGDSGGPLQLKSTSAYCMYNIIGITSFGKACGNVNVPGVYTRVSNYLDWLERVVWP